MYIASTNHSHEEDKADKENVMNSKEILSRWKIPKVKNPKNVQITSRIFSPSKDETVSDHEEGLKMDEEGLKSVRTTVHFVMLKVGVIFNQETEYLGLHKQCVEDRNQSVDEGRLKHLKHKLPTDFFKEEIPRKDSCGVKSSMNEPGLTITEALKPLASELSSIWDLLTEKCAYSHSWVIVEEPRHRTERILQVSKEHFYKIGRRRNLVVLSRNRNLYCDISDWLVISEAMKTKAINTSLYADIEPYNTGFVKVVVRGIFLLRKKEIDWFYGGGAITIYPDAWGPFKDLIPESERGCFVDASHKRLVSNDKDIQYVATRAWTKWEMMTARLMPNETTAEQGEDDQLYLALARIKNHYSVNKRKDDVVVGTSLLCDSMCKGKKWLLQDTIFITDVLLVALGGCDRVLRIQGLENLGVFKWDFKNLIMQFTLKERRLVPRGSVKDSSLPTICGKSLV